MSHPYEYVIPAPEDAARYAHLTYGTYAHLLSDPATLRAAALHRGQPIGLVVGAPHPAFAFTKLLSIFVDAAHRRRGVATRLVTLLEAQARQQGDTLLKASYVAPKPAVEGLLLTCGWQPPQHTMDILQAPFAALADLILQTPLPPLPTEAHVFPWEQRSQRDLETLRARAAEFGEALHPELDDTPLAAGSIGLRLGDQLAGWAILHPITSDMVRCSALFLFKEARRPGVWQRLVRAAYERQMAAYPYRTMVLPCVLPFARILKGYLGANVQAVQPYHEALKPL
ncbi:MAG: GNAT family N-acetyltransferase [Anaerolineae bacterium]